MKKLLAREYIESVARSLEKVRPATVLPCADLIQEPSRDGVLSGVWTGADIGTGDLLLALAELGDRSRVPDAAVATFRIGLEAMVGGSRIFTRCAAELFITFLPRAGDSLGRL